MLENVSPVHQKESLGLIEMTDMYYYENKNWESPYAVNYNASQRNWFVSHGFKLNYVTSREIILLGLIPVIEGNAVITD